MYSNVFEPSGLAPNECYDKELKCNIQLDNPSDALVARLALTFGFSHEELNLVIETILNPCFNSSEITFRNAGDVYARVAQSRIKQDVVLHSRSAVEPSRPGNIPWIVLDGIMDVLKADMSLGVRELMKESNSEYSMAVPSLHELDRVRESLLCDPRKTLSCCSLVHTSWYLPARRALGSALIRSFPKTDSLTPFIRNPCFGIWTQNLLICIPLDMDEPSQYLAALTSRMPNLRVVHLRLFGGSEEWNYGEWNVEDSRLISRALESLCRLEELLYVVNDRTAFEHLRNLVDVHIPTLKTIQFTCDNEELSSLSCKEFAKFSASLSALPSLETFNVVETSAKAWATVRISWVRANSADHPELVLNSLEYELGFLEDSESSPILRNHTDILSATRNLKIKFGQWLANAVILPDILRASSSVVNLDIEILIVHFSDADAIPIHALSSMSSTVEQLQVTFEISSSVTIECGAWPEETDRRIVTALSSCHHPRLRSLVIRLRYYHGTNASFPECSRWCKEEDVKLELYYKKHFL